MDGPHIYIKISDSKTHIINLNMEIDLYNINIFIKKVKGFINLCITKIYSEKLWGLSNI